MSTIWDVSGTYNTITNGVTATHITSQTWSACRSDTTKSSGKFEWEILINTAGTNRYIIIGCGSYDFTTYPGMAGSTESWGYGGNNGNKYNNGSTTSYGNTFTTGDVISPVLDLDNGKLYFKKNGVFQNSGDPAAGTGYAYSGISGNIKPGVGLYTVGTGITATFLGPDFDYEITSGFAPWDGYGTEITGNITQNQAYQLEQLLGNLIILGNIVQNQDYQIQLLSILPKIAGYVNQTQVHQWEFLNNFVQRIINTVVTENLSDKIIVDVAKSTLDIISSQAKILISINKE
jgi:hypothetical protein